MGANKKVTTADFITKAQAVHGVNKYDYSQAAYTMATSKVRIICPIHGVFEQTPNNHAAGYGCRACGGSLKSNTGLFIQQAQRLHGIDKFDYSQAHYSSNKAKVRIGCSIHGVFEQTPNSHLGGQGCPKCSGRHPLDTAGFIARSQAVHGECYDYSQVVYKNATSKVTIICKQHGLFEQKALAHLHSRAGCPKCAYQRRLLSWVERATGRISTLYFLRIFNESEEFYKVGVTLKPVNARFAGATLAGYEFELVALHTSSNALAVFEWEQSILESFAHLAYKPKIAFKGGSECFSRCEEILQVFPL